jgi:hypothetical protein
MRCKVKNYMEYLPSTFLEYVYKTGYLFLKKKGSVHNILWELKDTLRGPHFTTWQAACALHATSYLILPYTLENHRAVLFQNGRKTCLSFCPLLYLSRHYFFSTVLWNKRKDQDSPTLDPKDGTC